MATFRDAMDEMRKEFPELFKSDAEFAREQNNNIPKYEEYLRTQIQKEAIKFRSKESMEVKEVSIELGVRPNGNPNDMELYLALTFQEDYLKYLDQNNFIKKFEAYTTQIKGGQSGDEFLYARVSFIPRDFLNFLKSLTFNKGIKVSVEKGRCIIKFEKSEPIDIGGATSRHCLLLCFMFNAPDAPRKINDIYDAIQKPFDKTRYSLLGDETLALNEKKKIIENSRRELQRILKRKGKPKKVTLQYMHSGFGRDSYRLVIV